MTRNKELLKKKKEVPGEIHLIYISPTEAKRVMRYKGTMISHDTGN